MISERLHESARSIWECSRRHPFLAELAAGRLAEERFAFYMRQDYVFLIDYARLFGLAAAKAGDLATMAFFAEVLHATLHGEMELHRQYAEKFGVSRGQLEATEPSPVTLAYTRYMLHAASGSLAELVAALLPCMWSYAETGELLAASPGASHPLYGEWIGMYASEEFRALADRFRQLLDGLAEGLPERELAVLERHFMTASRFEHQFWDMAYKKAMWEV